MRSLTPRAAAVALVALALPAAPAVAVEYPTSPNAEGHAAVCNVDLEDWHSGSGWHSLIVRAKCNVGSTVGRMGLNYDTDLNGTWDVSIGSPTPPYDDNWTCGQGGARLVRHVAKFDTGGSQRFLFEWSAGCGGAGYGSHSPNWTVLLTAYNSAQTSTWPVRLAEVTRNGTAPEWYPVDHFPGGTAGGAPVYADNPPAECSRTLGDVATMAGYFKAVEPTDVEGVASYTYTWDFGDGTSAVGRDVTHRYPSLAAMPDGGWTAVLTRAVNPAPGYTAPAAVTCSLRVDFLNPANADPAGGSGADGNDSSDCPSGWGWLNPAAIVKVLLCLFVPTAGPWENLREAYEGSLVQTAAAPFTVLMGAWQSLVDGINDPDLTCEGMTFHVPLVPEGVDGVAPLDVEAAPFSVCESATLGTLATYAKKIIGFFIVYGTALLVVRNLSGAVGFGKEAAS